MTDLGTAAQRVARHMRTIVSLEVELARAELRRKAAALGLGAALLGAAALFGVLALWAAFVAVAAALALVLPAWAAWLVTAGILFVLAGLAVTAGIALLRRGSPPIPEQALEEARITRDALRGNGRG
jgi:uncharacterized membrane protein YqjE